MSTKDLVTVALRFRDLNVPDGETIVRHQQIASELGFTWWGWWAQANERVPVAAMRQIQRLANTEAGLNIFLFDSGRLKLFAATCVDTSFQPGGTAFRSPDASRTPGYYNERECRVWFGLRDLREVAFSEITSFTYLDVPEFFSDKAIDYSAVYGKKVATAKELESQHRTVWFLREGRPSDPKREVRVVARETVEPQTYVSEFAADASTKLLWFSDLHFSITPGHHAFPGRISPSGDERPIADAVEQSLEQEGDTFAGIIVSGDLTWAAEPKEFEQARAFLVRLSKRAAFTEASARRLAIAPGNHDLKFSATPALPGTEVRTVRPQYKRAYSKFYEDLFHRPPNEFLSAGRRFLLGRSLPVEIAVLNSVLLEQVPQPDAKGPGASTKVMRFQGQGYLGERQLSDVAKGMGWTSRPELAGRVIRVVVLHHHVVPVAYSEQAIYGANYSTVLDAGRLGEWLVSHRVDVVLHGHQHEPFVARLSRPADKKRGREWHTVHIVGMGSSGVVSDHRPVNNPNVFAVLDFRSDQLTVDIRSIEKTLKSESYRTWSLPLAPRSSS